MNPKPEVEREVDKKRYIFGIAIFLQLFLFHPIQAQPGPDLVKKGLAAYERQQWDEAVRAFQEAMAREPDNPRLNFNLGAAYFKKGQYEEALQSFQKAQHTTDSTLLEYAFYNLGNTLFLQEKYAEAVEAYKKALGMNPADRDAKHNLELARRKMKDQEQQEQQQQNQQERIIPSEYAKQLKAQADILVENRLYEEAYRLMEQGLRTDETVKAFQDYITRLKNVTEIEKLEGSSR